MIQKFRQAKRRAGISCLRRQAISATILIVSNKPHTRVLALKSPAYLDQFSDARRERKNGKTDYRQMFRLF